MPVPDIRKIIQQNIEGLRRINDRVLPVKVGRAVAESVRQNFRRGGFYGSPWKQPVRRSLGLDGADGQYGPLLSRQNHLMSSTDYIPGPARVTIRNDADYAEIHNEGGDITVTSRMKRYFWSRYYRSGTAGQATSRRKAAAHDGESEFWKRMALKRVGSTIRIPRRHFLGESPQVDRIVHDIIDRELKQFINGINTRRSR